LITHGDLIRDIDSCDTNAVWWLGQHSFVLKIAGKIVYIDPFLTSLPGRLVPPMLTPDEVKHADFICGTHDHTDHIDRDSWPPMARAAPQARFVVPDILREELCAFVHTAADRFIGFDDGKTLELAPGIKVSAIAAAHELLAPDPATGRYAFLGYIFEGGGVTVYHAGDTCWYDGLQTRLKRWQFDAMLVPINGRDATRFKANIVGNMTYQEAADLCGPLGPKMVIPTHWDMFATNLGDPQAFKEYVNVKYPGVRVLIPDYGRRITLGAD
jgi:L-ascorbate metabolism protein UlaG (beta-lactamase superfamily)